ncbi:SEC-C metal-binding domain-containing protein [Streptomyces longwoodensis]|uniref:SEC-C metal-binding domain-containing protein n=1 Tax=Streptomyces longwoodensis TaxID=68231 RepID=UPI003F53F7E5
MRASTPTPTTWSSWPQVCLGEVERYRAGEACWCGSGASYRECHGALLTFSNAGTCLNRPSERLNRSPPALEA